MRVLMVEVERARKSGWSLAQEEIELGVCGLSAAIKDPRGATRAVVSIRFKVPVRQEECA
jgi:DNA-binding IclR family transcriptional regulator